MAPTVVETGDPDFRLMQRGAVRPGRDRYVYPSKRYDETLELVDSGSPYGLTGAVFARDRARSTRRRRLRYAAGNFYVNDKPTGAVVGQQPFGGGARLGHERQGGHDVELIRWVSPRTMKETFVPPTDYRYPFMDPDTPH